MVFVAAAHAPVSTLVVERRYASPTLGEPGGVASESSITSCKILMSGAARITPSEPITRLEYESEALWRVVVERTIAMPTVVVPVVVLFPIITAEPCTSRVALVVVLEPPSSN